MLPAAAALAVLAPSSAILNRLVGTKFTTALGMALVAIGLWLTSAATVGWSYLDMLPQMVLIGGGASLVMPSVSTLVMGSLPRGDTGVGAGTNGAVIQTGGALGVAVIGSLLATRYQDLMTNSLASYPGPLSQSDIDTILGSVGGALDVAGRLGGPLGSQLAHTARSAFISGADQGLGVAAAVVAGGLVLTLTALPARAAN